MKSKTLKTLTLAAVLSLTLSTPAFASDLEEQRNALAESIEMIQLIPAQFTGLSHNEISAVWTASAEMRIEAQRVASELLSSPDASPGDRDMAQQLLSFMEQLRSTYLL